LALPFFPRDQARGRGMWGFLSAKKDTPFSPFFSLLSKGRDDKTFYPFFSGRRGGSPSIAPVGREMIDRFSFLFLKIRTTFFNVKCGAISPPPFRSYGARSIPPFFFFPSREIRRREMSFSSLRSEPPPLIEPPISGERDKPAFSPPIPFFVGRSDFFFFPPRCRAEKVGV